MSKAKRFTLTMLLGLAIIIPTRWWLEANYPLLDQALVVVSGFFVLYWSLRYLYEHWDA